MLDCCLIRFTLCFHVLHFQIQITLISTRLFIVKHFVQNSLTYMKCSYCHLVALVCYYTLQFGWYVASIRLQTELWKVLM